MTRQEEIAKLEVQCDAIHDRLRVLRDEETCSRLKGQIGKVRLGLNMDPDGRAVIVGLYVHIPEAVGRDCSSVDDWAFDGYTYEYVCGSWTCEMPQALYLWIGERVRKLCESTGLVVEVDIVLLDHIERHLRELRAAMIALGVPEEP